MIVSEETASQLGQRLVDYIEQSDIERSGQTPDLILGAADVRYSNFMDWLRQQVVLNELYLGAGIIRRPGISFFKDMEGAAAASYPLALTIPKENGTGQSCVVIPDTRSLPGGMLLEVLAELLGDKISDADKSRIPGTAEDWRAITLFHESGHCANPEDRLSDKGEYLADQHSFEKYFQAYDQGVVTDQDVPHALRAIRSVIAMTSLDFEHSASVLIPMPGEENIISSLSPDDFADVDVKMWKACDSVFAEIGQDAANACTQLQALLLMKDDQLQQIGITAEEKGHLSKIAYDEHADPAQVEALLRRYPVPAEFREEMDRYMDAIHITDGRITITDGRTIARNHPEVLYEYARRQLLRGDFDENPVQKAFVERFVDAAERYFPNTFHVPEDRIRNGPAIVRENTPQAGFPAPSPEQLSPRPN